MRKTSTWLADGRELFYYDTDDDVVRSAVDRRSLSPMTAVSEIRYDRLLGDAVAVAPHRQGRTYHPPSDECPFCSSRGGQQSEIPDADYAVTVFENRFPSLVGDSGRCEIVCFTSDHHARFADLTVEQAALVVEAWTDRTAELSKLPMIRQVFCYENRGAEIGVTLDHPHGQIYGYPFVAPSTALMLRSAAEYRMTTGRNLFDEVVASEQEEGTRVVLEGDYWVSFVPYAARWPYEVHLYPKQRVRDLRGLGGDARAEFSSMYLELLRRFDRIFDSCESPTPYISALHQAPFTEPGKAEGAEGDFALHLELFTIRREADKLKFFAGSEAGVGVFVNDVLPEAAAERIREVASC
ncbi:galactose-1-phosphate uridylyltransferase (plasmid) [Streptomyces sp. NBC_00440]|uniref:galactose-1-phosphate uridylyltransferase n=1 Tax=unclassified Streptomyces TaxID=2593676 RepID=UPI002E1C4471|nr:galactose-1-phosphate uridylyltransferase [Streptomyces sp. NBC_00963]